MELISLIIKKQHSMGKELKLEVSPLLIRSCKEFIVTNIVCTLNILHLQHNFKCNILF